MNQIQLNMIDPTQNTKRMSSGEKGSYTLGSNEDDNNWMDRLSEFFYKLTSDKEIESNSNKLVEHKEKLEQYKVEIENKLKEMRKSSDRDMDNIKRSLETSLNNIHSTLNHLDRRIN